MKSRPFFCCVFAFASLASAEVKLDPLFTDHAVLQHGVNVPIWGRADPGEFVNVRVGTQSHSVTADAGGNWMITLAPISPGGPYEIVARGKANTETRSDILFGEVWLCSGQSNMDFTIARTGERYWCGVADEANVIAAANHPRIRQFKVPLTFAESPIEEVTGGRWVPCSPETAGEFSAVAYFFALNLREKLPDDMPIGLLVSTYGASTAQTWMSRDAIESNDAIAHLLSQFEQAKLDWTAGKPQAEFEQAIREWEAAVAAAKADGKPEPRKPREPRDPLKNQHNPTLLYNGMIAPLHPYAFRGVIWYQGESNGITNEIYLPLMQSLIADWRSLWQNDFPFFAVQLASYRSPATLPVGRSQMANVREAQRQTALTVPKSAMAVTIDIGDEKDVHPKNKQDVGKRLALLALADVYGFTGFESRGPEPTSIEKLDGGKVRVNFDHADGLEARAVNTADATAVRGFALLDESGTWAWADATIDGHSVILHADAVPNPVEVRYAYADFPIANLFNSAGLPAGPFVMQIER